MPTGSKVPAAASMSSSGKGIQRLIEVVDADDERKTAAAAAARSGGITESPFAMTDADRRLNDQVQSENIDSYVIGPATSAGLDLTMENVDKVLEEIRPYLISDGGNVAVVAIDDFTRSISLTLQGACGSCPSSTVSNFTDSTPRRSTRDACFFFLVLFSMSLVPPPASLC